MDIKRYLLIAASAVLAIMLLSEWTSFKADREATLPRERIIDVNTVAQIPSSAILPISVEEDALGEDIPSVSIASSDPQSTITEIVTNHIRVVTDTMEIVIDLNGGDIVELALRKFPEAIDSPDIPFVFLEQNSTRTYIAQSGLVGPNGIDNNGRAHYQDTAPEFSQTPGQMLEVD